MRRIQLSYDEFFKLSKIQVKRWRGWHAVFSSNVLDHKWPCFTRGWSPLNARKTVRGNRVLDVLAQEYGRGGNEPRRMFINHDGAYFKIIAQQFEKFSDF